MTETQTTTTKKKATTIKNAPAIATKTRRKTTTTDSPKGKGAAKVAKPARAATVPKTEKVDAAELVTFAVRLPRAEAEALHAAAGPRRASKVAKALFAAFAAGDEAAFRAVLKEAREARG